MNNFKNIFKTGKPLIGMIHFPPLVGHPDFQGFDYIAEKMLMEAKILEESGFDAIIIENNYDVPHSEEISAPAAAMFASLARLLQENTKLPFGLDILWNDYKTSLAICASTNASFFRVPAFVDTVKTNYGIMSARALDVINLRHRLHLDHIAVLADIQVKHSEMVDKQKTLAQSAREAVASGADALVVTGQWTGDAPKTSDLSTTREAIGNFPILVGSGATIENLNIITDYADGVIVGTALKDGQILSKEKEVNLKPSSATLSHDRSIAFARKYKETLQNRINY